MNNPSSFEMMAAYAKRCKDQDVNKEHPGD